MGRQAGILSWFAKFWELQSNRENANWIQLAGSFISYPLITMFLWNHVCFLSFLLCFLSFLSVHICWPYLPIVCFFIPFRFLSFLLFLFRSFLGLLSCPLVFYFFLSIYPSSTTACGNLACGILSSSWNWTQCWCGPVILSHGLHPWVWMQCHVAFSFEIPFSKAFQSKAFGFGSWKIAFCLKFSVCPGYI